MPEEGTFRCGLDFAKANLRVSDTKHFGPEKFRANTADVYCGYLSCPLSSGLEVNFSAIAGESIQEVTSIFEEAATATDSRISEQLRQARLTQCPIYKSQFNVS